MEQFASIPEEEPNELLFLNCLNFLFFTGQAFVTIAIGQFGLFGFSSMQEISDLYPTLITAASIVPISVTFMLIVVQLIWATAQFFPDFRLRSNEGVKHYYVGVALCQIIWVLMVSYELLYISLFGAMALQCFLGFILYEQGKHKDITCTLDYWVLRAPFVFYVGWMVYVILWNINVVLVSSGVSSNAQYIVALVSLVAIGMTSFATIFFSRTDYAIPLLMAYVAIGISAALSDPDGKLVLRFEENQIDAVRITAILISSLAVTATALRAILNIIYGSKRRQGAEPDDAAMASGGSSRRSERRL